MTPRRWRAATRLSAEVQSRRQATVNAGQAVSMLQIADGAMSQVNEILIRMKTLSVQAASGQISDVERGMLDTEFQALLDEVDRISGDTEFNGTLLVAGSTTIDTQINGVTDADANQLQAADGVQSIEFNPAVGDPAMILDHDSSTGVLTLTNSDDPRIPGSRHRQCLRHTWQPGTGDRLR